MFEIIYREFVYLWYYIVLQVNLIAPYWILGVLIGSLISVFGKGRLTELFISLQDKNLGVFGLIPASIIGVASPLCLFGTIPIAASFSKKGIRDDWLAAFMMSSILLNPQLLLYSGVLGSQMFLLRLFFSLLGGVVAGLLVNIFYKEKSFFSFSDFTPRKSRDTHPNYFIRYIYNVYRNIKATGLYFAIGILLTALYQRYVPDDLVSNIFGSSNKGFGVLSAAALGVPLYVCGGGTVPLLAEWLYKGMSPGSAVAFMFSGPSTKITNLSAVKMIFTKKRFGLYLGYVILFSIISGLLVNLVL